MAVDLAEEATLNWHFKISENFAPSSFPPEPGPSDFLFRPALPSHRCWRPPRTFEREKGLGIADYRPTQVNAKCLTSKHVFSAKYLYTHLGLGGMFEIYRANFGAYSDIKGLVGTAVALRWGLWATSRTSTRIQPQHPRTNARHSLEGQPDTPENAAPWNWEPFRHPQTYAQAHWRTFCSDLKKVGPRRKSSHAVEGSISSARIASRGFRWIILPVPSSTRSWA